MSSCSCSVTSCPAVVVQSLRRGGDGRAGVRGGRLHRPQQHLRTKCYDDTTEVWSEVRDVAVYSAAHSAWPLIKLHRFMDDFSFFSYLTLINEVPTIMYIYLICIPLILDYDSHMYSFILTLFWTLTLLIQIFWLLYIYWALIIDFIIIYTYCYENSIDPWGWKKYGVAYPSNDNDYFQGLEMQGEWRETHGNDIKTRQGLQMKEWQTAYLL